MDLCGACREPAGEGREQRQAEPGEKQTQRAAAQREEHALGQHLSDEPAAACSERGSHRNLRLSLKYAREVEIGYVSADDE